MLINLIKRDLFPSLLYCGKTAGDAMERTLPVNVVLSPAEAVPLEGVLCLLYDDVPLLKENTLRHLFFRCQRERTGFALGDGFIKHVSYEGRLRFFRSPELVRADPESYAYVRKTMNARVLAQHKKNGVIVCSDDSVFIDFDVRICARAVIKPYSTLLGETYVGENAVIDGATVARSTVGDSSCVRLSVVEDSVIGKNCTVGPYAYLRQYTRIGDGCRVGDFVEIKNSTFASGVKAAHLTYVGDGEVGKGTNIGCGTVFCNYDGNVKRKVKVGKDVFIGANSNLVAPLSVGDGAYLAAGGTVTDDVPPSSFVIARPKQTVKRKK